MALSCAGTRTYCCAPTVIAAAVFTTESVTRDLEAVRAAVHQEPAPTAKVAYVFAAVAQPPHLCALFPVVTACDYYDEWTYRGGAFQQFFNQSWASFRLAPDTLNRRVLKSANAMRTNAIQRHTGVSRISNVTRI